MKLCSTQDISLQHSWSEAVLRGLAPDGGLYLPVQLPRLLTSATNLARLRALSFPELAFELAKLFLSEEVSEEDLHSICATSFTFDVPLADIGGNTTILELFHGPTCAFKDFGARFMARLFRHFLGKTSSPLTVLVATSGDTGGAVASAFLDSSPNPPIRVVILFPKGKVSLVQERQMTTLGHNVTAFEVEGTFDDCQALVKTALADQELTNSCKLTSANSINIARLLPQMFYYVYAALRVSASEAPIFSVPSGNLGNLTGGIIGQLIGMPAGHFIAACNINAPFPDFLESGQFQPRPSLETISNAMDVGHPSNFARLIAFYKNSLSDMRALLSGACVTDVDTLQAIKDTYNASGYILDPHTAVGLVALNRYRAATGSTAPGIVLATAAPGKFGDTVMKAIGRQPPFPPQLAEVLNRPGEKKPIKASYQDLRAHLLSSPATTY